MGIYMLPPTYFSTLIFFRCIPPPLHKTLIFTLFELNTGGNYIIPQISFLRSFENY